MKTNINTDKTNEVKEATILEIDEIEDDTDIPEDDIRGVLESMFYTIQQEGWDG